MTPKERAQKSANTMWVKDKASQWFDMTLVEADEGMAVLSMVLQEHHMNGHGTCHGGVIFSLADSAFGIACNTRNQVSVAQHNTISYRQPAYEGDTLTATAREIDLQGRNGITDVRVVDQKQNVIAEFRGASLTTRGQVFQEEG